MSFNIILNGLDRDFDNLTPPVLLTGVIAALGLKADRVAVELNGVIVERSHWHETTLAAGDKLEVVHFVGGGSVGHKIFCKTFNVR